MKLKIVLIYLMMAQNRRSHIVACRVLATPLASQGMTSERDLLSLRNMHNLFCIIIIIIIDDWLLLLVISHWLLVIGN